MKSCPFCNALNDDLNVICEECGREFTNESQEDTEEKVPTQEPNNDDMYSQNTEPTPPPPYGYGSKNTSAQRENYNPQMGYNPPVNNPYNMNYGFNENMLPPTYRSVSTGEWIMYLIVTGIPVAGFIILCVLAFGKNTKVSLKNFAKANLIFRVVAVAISLIMLIVFTSILGFSSI